MERVRIVDSALLLLAEVSEANNHAFVKLIVTGYVVLPVNGETVLKPLIVSDITIVAFFLQRFAVSLNGPLGSGHGRRQHQQEEQHAGNKVREWFPHGETPFESL